MIFGQLAETLHFHLLFRSHDSLADLRIFEPKLLVKNLPEIKKKLLDLIPVDLNLVIEQLKNLLPVGSEKYRLLLMIESSLSQSNRSSQQGIISHENLQIENNRALKNLLDLVADLEEKDFEAKSARAPKNDKQGILLYKIPRTMMQEEETECLIRIAYDEELIMENLKSTTDIQTKEIRTSEVMEVNLLDPFEGAHFQIRTISTGEQFVDEDDFTQWVFYIRPLKAGLLPLILKVSVIVNIGGKERKREIILEEKIQITTERKSENTEEAFRSAGYNFYFSSNTDPSDPADLEQSRRQNTYTKRAMAMTLGLIGIMFGIFYLPIANRSNKDGFGTETLDQRWSFGDPDVSRYVKEIQGSWQIIDLVPTDSLGQYTNSFKALADSNAVYTFSEHSDMTVSNFSGEITFNYQLDDNLLSVPGFMDSAKISIENIIADKMLVSVYYIEDGNSFSLSLMFERKD